VHQEPSLIALLTPTTYVASDDAVALLQAKWEDELDMMGFHADLDQLREHLAAAPNPASRYAQYLAQSIAEQTAEH
jgi:hypothetical protein